MNINSKNCKHLPEKKSKSLMILYWHLCVKLKWLWGTAYQANSFLVHASSNKSLSQILTFKMCWITRVQFTTMLQSYVIPELQQWSIVNDIIWMQDVAPTHAATRVRHVLKQHFGDRVSSINSAVLWLPDPPTSLRWISGSGLFEMEGVHAKSKRFARTEKCRKKWNYAHLSWDVTFVLS